MLVRSIVGAVLFSVGLAALPASNTVEYTVLKDAEECARRTQKGDAVIVHFTGRIHPDSEIGEPGAEFDSSYDVEAPFEFQLGTGEVVIGWEEGLLDMCEGETRQLNLSPEKGYGPSGHGQRVPGGAFLQFDVELLEIKDGLPEEELFSERDFYDQINTNTEDGGISKEEMISFLGIDAPPGDDQIVDNSEVEEHVNEMFKADDTDGDGLISYEEFVASHEAIEGDEVEPEGYDGPPPPGDHHEL